MLSRIFDASVRVAAPVIFPGAGREVTQADVERGLAPGERLSWSPTTRPGEEVALIRRPAAPELTSGESRCTLFLYGNAMVLADTPQLRAVLADRGAGVVCVDYVGYGLSRGTPSERGCYRAAHTALDLAELVAGVGQVDVVGWSLGSAVALQLAAARPVRRLVLLSPMSGVSAYVLAPVRLAGTPLRKLGPFAGAGKVDRIRCPVLLVSGTADQVTPTSMAYDLAAGLRARAGSPAGDPGTELMLVDGAQHNDLFGHTEVWHRTLAFLAPSHGPSTDPRVGPA